MLIRSEGYFKGYHDTKLYYQKWEHKTPKALVIITHGQGEHSECFLRLINALSELPLSFIAWDMRGHGRSEGTRGYARDFFEYIHDYEVFLKQIEEDSDLQALPKILLAHSMGGLVQMKTVLGRNQDEFKLQILSSPLFGIGIDVPLVKQFAAKMMYSLAPQITLWNEISHENLTRDPAIIQEFERDALRHDKISSGVYLGSLRAMEFIHARANKLKVPTFAQIPEKDEVVSSEKTKEFFAKADPKIYQLKTYSDRKHEIYNDLGREIIFEDLLQFLNGHL